MRMFNPPVTVTVGLGFPVRIRSASAAATYLEAMAPSSKDLVWEATLTACRASSEDSRDVFAAFARRRGILVEEDELQVAAA